MKIEINDEIANFLNRCLENCNDEIINSFIGLEISKEHELEVQKSLDSNNFFGFDNPSDYPSLYTSVDEYLKTPYNANIKLDCINSESFTYDYEEMPANVLYNVSDIISDPKRELHDTMELKAYDKPYKTTILSQDNEFWMTDTIAEANTINPYAEKAYGNVVTFGLGIGYFVYMSLLNINVEHITIIERSEEVITMFKNYLLPQFPNQDKITIVKGDAFNYFNKDYLSKFDYIFVDIYKSNDDGFIIIEKMLEQYLPATNKIDFWIENSCFEFTRAIMLSYFIDLCNDSTTHFDNELYDRIYSKIKDYFNSSNNIITKVDELKDILYSKELIREIISKK
jgi:hypothetical protein